MNMGPVNIPGQGIGGQGQLSHLTTGQNAQEAQRTTRAPMTQDSNLTHSEVARYTPTTVGTPSQAAVIIAEFMAAANELTNEMREKAEYLKKKGIKTRIVLDADGNPVLEIFDNTGNINERYKDTDGDAKMEERDRDFRRLLTPGNERLAGVLAACSYGLRSSPRYVQTPQKDTDIPVSQKDKVPRQNLDTILTFVQVQLNAKGHGQLSAVDLYYEGKLDHIAKELGIQLPDMPEPEVSPLQLAAKFFKAAFLSFKKKLQ
jgi:hypothetical protein